MLRSGAKAGDWVFVTGPLGGSILGHHLSFTPRVREALKLHEAADLHAMLDISDGLGAEVLNQNEGAESTLALHRAALVLDAAGVRGPVREHARELSTV